MFGKSGATKGCSKGGAFIGACIGCGSSNGSIISGCRISCTTDLGQRLLIKGPFKNYVNFFIKKIKTVMYLKIEL